MARFDPEVSPSPNVYYPSIRAIAIVLFDPGSLRIGFDDRDVRQEDNPGPISQKTGRPADRINDKRGTTGIGSIADPVRRAFEANVDLADAIWKLDLEEGLTQVVDFVPMSAQIARNSYRMADELSLTANWRDLPYDARIIRAMAVFFFAGTLPGATGLAAPFEGPPRPGVAPGSIVPATRENLRFIGLADMARDAHDSGGDTVELKCRDLTGVFIDKKLPPKLRKKIEPGSNLRDVVSNLKATLDGTEAEFIREVVVRPAGTQLPRLNRKRYTKLATPANKRVQAARSGGGAEPVVVKNAKGQQESYWDAITDLCVSHGFVPIIELDRLILQRPRTFFKDQPEAPGRDGVPQFAREEGGVRTMAYGRNLEDLQFSRKLHHDKAPTVRVTSLNPDAARASERLLEARYPPRNRRGGRNVANNVDPTGKSKQENVVNKLVYGVTDQDLLDQIAEAAYEGIARQEMRVTFSTADLASLSAIEGFKPNEDPDLLALKAGDPIRLLIEPVEADDRSYFSLTELNKMITRARARYQRTGNADVNDYDARDAVQYLKARGFSAEQARQLARILGSSGLQEVFRVQQVRMSFDMAAGSVGLDIDAVNYVVARASALNSTNGVSTRETPDGLIDIDLPLLGTEP